MKTVKVASIIIEVVKDINKPATPVAIQAMNETELLILLLTGGILPSEVIEVYSSLRRINSVKYRDIDFKLEAEKIGMSTDEPYFWERPENRDITPGSL